MDICDYWPKFDLIFASIDEIREVVTPNCITISDYLKLKLIFEPFWQRGPGRNFQDKYMYTLQLTLLVQKIIPGDEVEVINLTHLHQIDQ